MSADQPDLVQFLHSISDSISQLASEMNLADSYKWKLFIKELKKSQPKAFKDLASCKALSIFRNFGEIHHHKLSCTFPNNIIDSIRYGRCGIYAYINIKGLTNFEYRGYILGWLIHNILIIGKSLLNEQCIYCMEPKIRGLNTFDGQYNSLSTLLSIECKNSKLPGQCHRTFIHLFLYHHVHPYTIERSIDFYSNWISLRAFMIFESEHISSFLQNITVSHLQRMVGGFLDRLSEVLLFNPFELPGPGRKGLTISNLL